MSLQHLYPVIFIFIFGTYHYCHAITDCNWIGGSGDWIAPEKWIPAAIPDASCRVIIGNMSLSDVLVIPTSNYHIHDLIISNTTLGTIYLMSNISIVVNNSLVIDGGILQGASVTSSIIISSTSTTFGQDTATNSRRTLRSLTINQSNGTMILKDMELVMNNAVITIASNATLHLNSTSASSSASIKNDVSRLYYDRYDASVLNTIVNLNFAVPVTNAVYDLIINSVERVNATLSHSMITDNDYTWPYAVETDHQAQIYYAYHVAHWLPGEHKSSKYNRSIVDVDVDECAMICNFYSWCKSFDHHIPDKLCLLSAYLFKHIGGLSVNSSWTHFSQRSMMRLSESKLIIDGRMVIADGSQAFINIDTEINGILQIRDVYASFSRELIVDGVIEFQSISYLAMNSSLSSLKASPSSWFKLSSNDASSYYHISFNGGSHSIGSMMTEKSIILVMNDASLEWMLNSFSSNDYHGVSVTNSSTVKIISNLSAIMNIDMFEISDNSHVSGSELNITANLTIIDSTSVLSVSGRGYGVDAGPSHGLAHDTSASGGSHGGLGGVGAVDTSGSSYGSAISPSQAGSGGGSCRLSSSSSSSGGQGGGVLHLSSKRLLLHGIIESAGSDGGVSCVGGGAGGSILIRSHDMSGNGMISCKGGDGGFAGGSAAGGGGAGGRIALYADTLSYNGSIDVSGGYRPITADRVVENAGAGSFCIKACVSLTSLSCSHIQALVTADDVLTGYFSTLQTRQSLASSSSINIQPKDTILYHESSPRTRGAYISDSSTSFDSSIPLDIHIIGSSPLILTGASIELGNVIGSDSAVLILENNIHVTAHQYNVTLQSCTMYIANASMETMTSYHIGAGGQLVLYDHQPFSFKSMSLYDYGSIITLNESMTISGDLLSFQPSGGILSTNGAINLSIARIEIYQSIFMYTYATTNIKYSYPISFILPSNAVMMFYGSLYLHPTATMNIHGSMIFQAGGIQDLSYDDDNMIITGQPYQNLYPSMMIASQSYVTIMSNTIIYLHIHLQLEGGDMIIDSSSSLYLQEGTITCSSNQSMSISSHSYLIIDQTAHFYVNSCDDIFLGEGEVIVQAGGVLYPSLSMSASSCDIIVQDGGEIKYGDNLSYKINSHVMIGSEGIMMVGNNTAVSNMDTLTIFAGVLIFDAKSSSLNISGNAVIHSGLIHGPGYLTINADGLLTCTNTSSSSSSSYESSLLYHQLTILQTSIINHGTMRFINATVNFARSLTFHNYAMIEFVNSIWSSQQRLYAYRLYESYISSFGLESPGGGFYYNQSQISCASICQNHHIRHVRQLLSTQKYADELYACVGFYYQQKLSMCQLLTIRISLDVDGLIPIQLPDFERSSSNVSSDNVWDFYAIDASWSKESTIVNDEFGSINIYTNSGTGMNGIYVPMINRGTFVVSDASYIELGNMFIHTAAGSMYINGTVLFTGSSLTSGSADESMSSYLANNTADVSTSSNRSSTIQGAIYGTGSIIFAGRLHFIHMNSFISTSLHIIISGQVQLVDVDIMHISKLSIDAHGELYVYNQPLTISSNDMMIAGIIQSHDQVIKAWQSSSSIVGLNCSTCYDVMINCPSLHINSTGRISLAHGIITSALLSIDDHGSLSCAGRGYTSQEIFRVNHSISSSLNISSWAGIYGLLGSSGGSHGSSRGGLGYGYGYDVTSGVFNNIPLESVSYQDYPYQQMQYQRRVLLSSWSYDAYYDFLAWGTPGGDWLSSKGGQGGGSLRILSSHIILLGDIICDGESVYESLAGGGAAGSVLIAATSIAGGGIISASGGAGGYESNDIHIQAGGGGGGRLIIVVNDTSSFTGGMKAFGGQGYEAGSSGTIVMYDNVGSYGDKNLISSFESISSLPKIIIDNQGMITATATVITSKDTKYGLIDSIAALGSSVVNISTHRESVYINNFISDGTGIIQISDSIIITNHNLSLQLESITLHLDNDASLIVDDLYLTNRSTLRISEQSSIAPSVDKLAPASHSMNTLSISDSSNFLISYLDSFDDIININVSSAVSIEMNSYMTSSGQGYRTASSALQGGGGHGGKGGQSMTGQGQTEYGNVTLPMTFGRAGGGTIYSSAGVGAGGGVVYLTVPNLVLYGNLTADGNDAYLPGASGGAGGSILIYTSYIHGTGAITANGGHGLYSDAYFGGGGSGGRIAVYCSNCSIDDDTLSKAINNLHEVHIHPYFQGIIRAHGGSTLYRPDVDPQVRALEADEGTDIDEWLETHPYASSSGTIYLSTSSTDNLILDNSKKSTYDGVYDYIDVYNVYTITSKSYHLTSSITILTSSPTSLSFDNVFISRYAGLQISNGLDFSISSYIDDGTGEIHIAHDGTLNLPRTFTLSQGNITILGSLYGALDVLLMNSSSINLHPTAIWASSSLHHVNISSLTLMQNSTIQIIGGNVYAEHTVLTIYCDLVNISDSSSTITASGQGYSASGIEGAILSAGEVISSYQANSNTSYADGGWHSGRGGGRLASYNSAGVAYQPIAWGRAGGSTYMHAGSNGGGAVRIIASMSIINNGLISANGDDCLDPESTAGTGAGGSVWITVIEGSLSGYGRIEANGGQGCLIGGGAGAAGRIAVWDSTRGSSYTGSYAIQAGSQTSSTILTYIPAGGTIFLAYKNGSSGLLLASNHGYGGNSISIYGENENAGNYSIVSILDDIYLYDANLTLPLLSLTIASRVRTFDPTVINLATIVPISASSSCSSSRNGYMLVDDRAVLVLGDDNNATIERDTIVSNGALLYRNNLTISSRLIISPLHALSSVISQDQFMMISGNATSTTLSSIYPASSSHSPSSKFYNEFKYNDLAILSGGRLTLSTINHDIYSNQSLLITATSIIIEVGGMIDGSSLYSTSTTSLSPSYQSDGNAGAFNTGASGGGHAGYGEVGYRNSVVDSSSSSSRERGDIFYPIGSGGAGGNGQSSGDRGGAGGAGICIITSIMMLIDGIISVDGESSSLGTAAGGGAGGSLLLISSSLIGNGSITARGGHGSISTSSLVHGGSGSGGRISLLACNQVNDAAYTGSVDARGGLTLQLASLSSLMRSYRSSQRLTSAAAGTIIWHHVDDDACASIIDMDNINNIDFNNISSSHNLIISSWSSQLVDTVVDMASTYTNHALSSCNTSYDYIVLDAIAQSLGFASLLSYASTNNINIITSPTIMHLPTTKSFTSITMINASLSMYDSGQLSVASIYGDSRSSMIFYDYASFVAYHNSSYDSYAINNISMSFYDCSYFMYDDILDLTVANGAILSFIANDYHNCSYDDNRENIMLHFVNDSALSSSASSTTVQINSSYTMNVHTLSMIGHAIVQGRFIAIQALSLSMYDNSSINTDGRGYDGGSIIHMKPHGGGGEGGGGAEDVGGNGGANGGDGGLGISAYYRLKQYDIIYDNTGISVHNINISSFINTDGDNELGVSYGDYRYPLWYGSGGGAVSGSDGRGGNGGGVVILDIGSDIIVDDGCRISANGESRYSGGGAGAGGSIFISASSSSSGNRIIGAGSISARGGSTCMPTMNCSLSTDYPGGYGAGGRIRLDADISSYKGKISAVSGASLFDNDMMLNKYHGTIIDASSSVMIAMSSYNSSSYAIDVILSSPTRRMVQVISTSGHGDGDRNNSDAFYAIIKGSWELSYRSHQHKISLPSQATAIQVQEALLSSYHDMIHHVNVIRKANSMNGWDWIITFYDELPTAELVTVTGDNLYTTSNNSYHNNNTASIIASFIPSYGDDYLTYTSSTSDDEVAYSRYAYDDIVSFIGFNHEVYGNITSYAYWVDLSTYRIIPASSYDIINNISSLRVKYLMPVPGIAGWHSSLNIASAISPTALPISTPT